MPDDENVVQEESKTNMTDNTDIEIDRNATKENDQSERKTPIKKKIVKKPDLLLAEELKEKPKKKKNKEKKEDKSKKKAKKKDKKKAKEHEKKKDRKKDKKEKKNKNSKKKKK